MSFRANRLALNRMGSIIDIMSDPRRGRRVTAGVAIVAVLTTLFLFLGFRWHNSPATSPTTSW